MKYLIVCILFCCFNGFCENPKVINIATEEYKPFVSKDLKGNGFLARIVREAFKSQGISVELNIVPAARGYNMTKAGKYDGTFPWAKRKERLDHFYYGEPILESDIEVFFYLKGTEFKWDPKKQDYNQLKGLTIGGIEGANYGDAFTEAEKKGIIKVSRVTSTAQNFKMLLNKRIDLMITPKTIAEYILHNDFIGLKSKITQRLAIDEPVEYDYLLISKKSKHGKFFYDAMNKGLKEIKANGAYDKILKTKNQE